MRQHHSRQCHLCLLLPFEPDSVPPMIQALCPYACLQSYLLEGQTLTKAHNKMPLSSKCLTSLLQVQSRCLYNVQSAFLRLQNDLDPLMKPVPAPSIVSSLPPVPSEQSKPLICRVPSNEDMHSTNRIISHVLRKVSHSQRPSRPCLMLKASPTLP